MSLAQNRFGKSRDSCVYFFFAPPYTSCLASQVGPVVKTLPANTGDGGHLGSIPGSGRPPGGGHGSPLQYSCLENPEDRGAWWAAAHRDTKTQTQQKRPRAHADFVLITGGKQVNLKGIACNDIQTNSPAALETLGTDQAACSTTCSTPGGLPTFVGGPLRTRRRILCVTRMNPHTHTV